jgi:hypothetical protein
LVDFHSTRHTYISSIVAGGATVKTAQELARHSSPALTIGRYSHARMHDLIGALDSSPNVSFQSPGEFSDVAVLRATGTDNVSTEKPTGGKMGSDWGSAQKACPGMPVANLGESIAECTEDTTQSNLLLMNTLGQQWRETANPGESKRSPVHPSHHPSCGRGSKGERG